MDDVRNLKALVEQCDVAVGEVDRGTSSSSEVVAGTDGGGDDQIVDDFTIDLSNHFVGHQVSENALGVNVLDALEVLGSLEGPCGLELAGDSTDGVAVDAQGDFWLEGVSFQVILVIDPSDGTCWEGASGEGDADSTGAVGEGGCAGGDGVYCECAGEFGAVTDQDNLWGSGVVEGDSEAWGWVFTIGAGVCLGGINFDHDGTGEYWALGQGAGDDVAAADGEVLSVDFV